MHKKKNGVKIKIRASPLLYNIYPRTKSNLVLEKKNILKKKKQKHLVCFKNIIVNVFLRDLGVIGHALNVIVFIKQL